MGRSVTKISAVLGLGLVGYLAACSSSTSNEGQSQDAITNGTPARGYTEAVMLDVFKNGQIAGKCSGALLSPRVVLTAGHCVDGFTGWRAVAPYARNQSSVSSLALTYDWKNETKFSAKHHDVGLIVLDTEIQLGEGQYATISSTTLGATDYAVHVGRMKDGQYSETDMFQSPANQLSIGKKRGYPFTYYLKNGVSQKGDGGGPVVLSGSTPHKVVGIIAGAGKKSAYEYVASLNDAPLVSWIEAQMKAYPSSTGGGGASTDGGTGSRGGTRDGGAAPGTGRRDGGTPIPSGGTTTGGGTTPGPRPTVDAGTTPRPDAGSGTVADAGTLEGGARDAAAEAGATPLGTGTTPDTGIINECDELRRAKGRCLGNDSDALQVCGDDRVIRVVECATEGKVCSKDETGRSDCRERTEGTPTPTPASRATRCEELQSSGGQCIGDDADRLETCDESGTLHSEECAGRGMECVVNGCEEGKAACCPKTVADDDSDAGATPVTEDVIPGGGVNDPTGECAGLLESGPVCGGYDGHTLRACDPISKRVVESACLAEGKTCEFNTCKRNASACCGAGYDAETDDAGAGPDGGTDGGPSTGRSPDPECADGTLTYVSECALDGLTVHWCDNGAYHEQYCPSYGEYICHPYCSSGEACCE